jgi:integrase
MAGARRNPSSSGRYQGFFTDSQGKKRYFTGSAKRSETLRMARKLEEDHRQIRLGYREPRQTHFKHRDRSFSDTTNEYLDWGKHQGGRGGRPWSGHHESRKRRHLSLWAETLYLKVLGDLDNILPRVEATLRELHERGKSGKTLVNITDALQSFCNWCVIRNYLSDNPLVRLSKIDTTPKDKYRALTVDEIRRLLEVAPEPLRLLYIIAMTTGLRASELRALAREHLDAENNGLWLEATWTKNRKAAFQPLPKRLVERLACFCTSGIVPNLYQKYFRKFTCPDDALLYVPSHPARTLDKDLETAGIPKHTAEGKIAFHALRTCFITLAFEAGANHREAQQLARHSTPALTANLYGRTRNERLAEVAGKVADRVLLGELGANMVRETEQPVTTDNDKPLQPKIVTAQEKEWRRGDSNPRPVMLRDKLLHA